MAQSAGKSTATKASAKKSELPPKSAAKKAASAPAKASTAKPVSAKGTGKASPRKAVASPPVKGNGESKRMAPKKARSTPRLMGGVTPEQRYRMICDAAYFRAERRGFVGGNAVQDWLDAESEIDTLLREMQAGVCA